MLPATFTKFHCFLLLRLVWLPLENFNYSNSTWMDRWIEGEALGCGLIPIVFICIVFQGDCLPPGLGVSWRQMICPAPFSSPSMWTIISLELLRVNGAHQNRIFYEEMIGLSPKTLALNTDLCCRQKSVFCKMPSKRKFHHMLQFSGALLPYTSDIPYSIYSHTKHHYKHENLKSKQIVGSKDRLLFHHLSTHKSVQRFWRHYVFEP